jgi:hypothetical protein
MNVVIDVVTGDTQISPDLTYRPGHGDTIPRN